MQAMGEMDVSDVTEGMNGNGVATAEVSPVDKADAGKGKRKRDSGLDTVDTLSAARIKQAENGDEKRKEEQAFFARYEARVKAVRKQTILHFSVAQADQRSAHGDNFFTHAAQPTFAHVFASSATK